MVQVHKFSDVRKMSFNVVLLEDRGLNVEKSAKNNVKDSNFSKKNFSSKEAVRGKKYSLLNSISPLILT